MDETEVKGKNDFKFMTIQDEDDIILDPEELIAYENLKKAEKYFQAQSQTQEEKSSVAKAILPSSLMINEEDRLKEKLKEIKIKNEKWVETLCLDTKEQIKLENFDDEFERENLFYQQTLETSYLAWDKMREENIPLIRPDDYFAEMLKSDKQMLKIKENLISKKKEIQQRELNQQRKEQKKFGKQIQQQKLKEKIQKKKQNLEAIKYWKTSQKGKEFDIKKLDENVKLMQENNIRDADTFKKFKNIQNSKKPSGVKKNQKRPGKSKRRRK
eukprot:gene9943-2264_t